MPAAALLLSSPQPRSLPPQRPAALRRNPATLDWLAAFSNEIEEREQRLRAGIGRLAARYSKLPFDAEGIIEMLARPLGPQIMMMAARVMVLELNVARLEGRLAGDTPEERFASFSGSLRDPAVRAALLSEYPILAGQVANRLDKWAAFSLEFLEHLCQDWPRLGELAPHPGTVVAVDTGAGDTHRGGRSVVIVGLSNGSKVVYKPRSLAVDRHFQELLLWLNERGAKPHFQPIRILDRGGHGWSEFIAAANCGSAEEVERFYQRQGAFLAILYALRATDFHFENLIASGEHPMLIDLEALFHPRTDRSGVVQDPGVEGMSMSVLSTGLLPLHITGGEALGILDLSGLTNPAGQLSRSASPVWERAGTDEMHVVRRRLELAGGQNCPALRGQEVRALDYAPAIQRGFSATYRLLWEHKAGFSEFVDRFANDQVRFIARASRTYGVLHVESFHPDALRDEATRLQLFDRLKAAVPQQPYLERLVDAERADLLRGDIPLFHSLPSSTHAWSSDGQCIPGLFAVPALTEVKVRIDGLGKEDLERQSWMVRAALATAGAGEMGRRGGRFADASVQARRTPSTDELISGAAAVGDRLAELAYRNGDKANWIGLKIVDETRREISPLMHDLYDGLPGVALFMAHLGRVTGEGRYRELAQMAVNTLRADVTAIGAADLGTGGFAGGGGVIYGLCHLSQALGNAGLLDLAEGILAGAKHAIDADVNLDVISGSAGLALALRSLGKLRPSAEVTAALRLCGEHLLSKASPAAPGLGWIPPFTDVALTGFAHGNAGIAYALLTVAEATGEERFREAARAAVEYERAVFSAGHANWPDLRRDSTGFAMAWCHGAPGIGMARVCSLPYLDGPLMREEIGIALRTTAADGFDGVHVTCHGGLGNADILLHAAEALGEQRWRETAFQQAARILDSRRRAGNWWLEHPYEVDPPGYMTGLAGIGYTLLRLVDPARTPCVLALDPPEAR